MYQKWHILLEILYWFFNILKISWKFSEDLIKIFGNFPQNLQEYSQHFVIPTNFTLKIFIFYTKISWIIIIIYKIYPTISTDQNCQNVYAYERRKIWVSGADKRCIITVWCISRKRLVHSYWIPNLQNSIDTEVWEYHVIFKVIIAQP